MDAKEAAQGRPAKLSLVVGRPQNNLIELPLADGWDGMVSSATSKQTT